MDLVTILNILIAALSIGFGAAGWLAPGYTMKTLDLADGGSTMGTSETRAASGALFVSAGIGAMLLGSPAGYAMLGFIWAGGGVGRLTSLIVDGQTPLKWKFFAAEAVIGGLGIAINI
ncbi:DUF4345 family protein [Jannaschia ovalis]|uniref:DUF4345 family protein n=1 Tax=Jannaschia ovalis TaxID=3038773 RepID=A0ABY8LCU3_9RHOB|nr:DUF4345 family protein [Jannaschia sp. GRR-S6-38]WGH78422.1 DUF4345 family protein [Jannaschia sp. GRR-S6-38]